MSIIITNITNPATPTGKSKYRIMINHRVIATYWHNREDGYAVCLKKASEAVERYNPKVGENEIPENI